MAFGIDDTAIATAAAAAASYAGQSSANSQNKDIWRKQQDWSEMMSSTAYQRAVADMKKAGLNPALMYSKGAGAASTPGSSIGAPMQDSVGKGASTALQAKLLQAQLAKNEADIKEVNSRTDLNRAQILSTTATTAKSRATQPIYDLLQDVARTGADFVKNYGKQPHSAKSASVNLSKGLFGR